MPAHVTQPTNARMAPIMTAEVMDTIPYGEIRLGGEF
jgi:hypothetical protein